jgi:antitoxin CptB
MGDLDRIRWNCRRGLLELDLVLATFLDRHLDRLDAQQIELVRALLERPDNDLLDLVMGRAESPDPRYATVLEMMRAA